MADEFLLRMEGISKLFPGVVALDGVDLEVRPGTVHALTGENGAGKSTLMKVLIGMYQEDSGTITFEGKQVKIPDTKTGLGLGISMIHQELSYVPELTVAENIYLGREPRGKLGLVSHEQMSNDAKALFERWGIKINPNEQMKHLSVAQAQMVEIAKAISFDSRLIIMDEPTSAMTEHEVEHLYAMIAQLKDNGVSVIYITHKLDEVFKISDYVTVFRDGKLVKMLPAAELDRNKLINLMVGRELTRGEILGLAGLMGAGRTEVLETVFGIMKAESGEIVVDGKTRKITQPKDAIAANIGLLTEDRKQTGIMGVLSVRDNMIVAALPKYSPKGMLQPKRIDDACEAQRKALAVKTPSLNQLIENLSGGNQQKVLISRWLLTLPEILMIDEPTRGVDVGAKSEIHRLMSMLAQQNKAILMVSSEMPEVLGMSDRILVMHEGRITGELSREDATQEKIMQLATGTTQEA